MVVCYFCNHVQLTPMSLTGYITRQITQWMKTYAFGATKDLLSSSLIYSPKEGSVARSISMNMTKLTKVNDVTQS